MNGSRAYITIATQGVKEIVCVCVRLDEGETIMRTLSDFWIVCRKSGHRRFFVILTQKNANFAEINGELLLTQNECSHARTHIHTEEVRKLCQREFTNIFFLD